MPLPRSQMRANRCATLSSSEDGVHPDAEAPLSLPTNERMDSALRQRTAPPTQAMIQLLGRSRVRSIGLGLLILLMLMMPISYRAGTETSHTHSILQGVVDTVTGHTHHHGEQPDAGTASSPVLSPFAPATVPLGSRTTAPVPSTGTQSTAPDIPEHIGLYSPIETSSPIHELGSLIALLLSGTACAALWGSVNRLLQVCITQDPPPPRLAS